MSQLNSSSRGVIAKYNEFFDPASRVNPSYTVTLGEGNTPLVKLVGLEAHYGIKACVYAKLEGCNPTHSFKDRGMSMKSS